MTSIRRYGALLALTLTLVLAACSSPDDFNEPVGLEPQFGSADTDDGIDVATLSTGRIYSLASQRGGIYEYNEEYGESEEVGSYNDLHLRRYDAAGKLTWTRKVAGTSCYYYYDDCDSLIGRSVHSDTAGSIYTTLSSSGFAADCTPYQSSSISKYDSSGSHIKTIWLGTTASYIGESYNRAVATTVDASGNIYAAREKIDNIDLYSFCEEGGTPVQAISKYNTNGTLLWQRTSTVGIAYGITVSSSGNVYVTGSKGVARYTSSGNLTWSKAVGSAEQIMVTGSYLYTRALNTLRKYDANGKLLWSKAQSGLSGLVTQDMTSDSSGNLYLSGKYNASSTNRNAFTRKLNSSGSVLWTKTFGTTTFDDAKGIATISGSEIYVTGLTKGSLSHTNIGGDDGYIRKLNSSGNFVWSK